MTTTEVLTGPVGAEGRNDEKDAKLVRRRLDDWRAREAGEPGGRPLPDGPLFVLMSYLLVSRWRASFIRRWP